MINKKTGFILFILLLCISHVYAEPVVTLPEKLIIHNGKIIVPVYLNNTNSANDVIYGFALRMTYDMTAINNPRYLSSNTLSGKFENTEIWFTTEPYDQCGDISISCYNLNQVADGILIKLIFDIVSYANIQTDILFCKPNEKTILFNSGFDKIETSFINKHIEIKRVDMSDVIGLLKKLLSISIQKQF